VLKRFPKPVCDGDCGPTAGCLKCGVQWSPEEVDRYERRKREGESGG
jgi:hypothetical protein